MVWLTVAGAAGVLFIWLVAVPRGMLPEVTGWGASVWAALLGAAVMVVNFILCRLCRAPATPIDHRQLASTATVSILCGASLLLSTAFDVGTWLSSGNTPVPNEKVISGMDGVLLVLTMAFGVLGGVFLARLGFSWLTKDISEHGEMRLMALTPMAWAWMRLARYMVSYTSAVDVQKNIGEFLMLIFTILFFYSFARYVAAVGKPSEKSPMLLFYACGAFLFSSTAAVVRLSAYWNSDAVTSLPQLAGAADMAVGLMAMAVAASIAYTRRTETVFERVQAKHPEWLLPEEPKKATKEKAQPQPESVSPTEANSVADVPKEAPAVPQTAANLAEAPVDQAASGMELEDILREIYEDKP